MEAKELRSQIAGCQRMIDRNYPVKLTVVELISLITIISEDLISLREQVVKIIKE